MYDLCGVCVVVVEFVLMRCCFVVCAAGFVLLFNIPVVFVL